MASTLRSIIPVTKTVIATPKSLLIYKTFPAIKPEDIAEYRHRLLAKISAVISTLSGRKPQTEYLNIVLGEIFDNFCRYGSQGICRLLIEVQWPPARVYIIAANPTDRTNGPIIHDLPPDELLEDHGRGLSMIEACSYYSCIFVTNGSAITTTVVDLN